MTGKKLREKVVAEVTLAHLMEFAAESGCSLTLEEASAFLNQNGCAYAMWKHMMQAAGEFLKTRLAQQTPAVVKTNRPTRIAV